MDEARGSGTDFAGLFAYRRAELSMIAARLRTDDVQGLLLVARSFAESGAEALGEAGCEVMLGKANVAIDHQLVADGRPATAMVASLLYDRLFAVLRAEGWLDPP